MSSDVLYDCDTAAQAEETLWERRLQHLWGDEPPYDLQAEDTADPFIGNFFYTWIGELMRCAAREELRQSMLPGPMRPLRAFNSGLTLSHVLRQYRGRRLQWDTFASARCRVCLRRERHTGLSGVLRYVGPVQQYRCPSQLYAGIEWPHSPPAPAAEGLPGSVLSDGLVEGEHLFRASGTAGCVTFERVEDVALLPSSQHSGSPDSLPLRARTSPGTLKLLRALFQALGRHAYIIVPLRVIMDAITYLVPLLLQRYIRYLESDDAESQSWSLGLGLVVVYFALLAFKSCVANKYAHLMSRCSLTFKSALTTVLFEKCFTVSAKPLALPEMNTGRLVSMMSSDVERIKSFVEILWSVIAMPFQLVAALWILYGIVGWSTFAGVAILVLMIPVHGVIMNLIGKQFMAKAVAADARIRATNELLSGIRVAKYMSWEPFFIANIERKRAVELAVIRKLQMIFLLITYVMNATPSLVIASVFFTYSASGKHLTPSVVFPTISMLFVLQMPFMTIPMAAQMTMQVMVAVRRIVRFLECEDTPDDSLHQLVATQERERAAELQFEQDMAGLPASAIFVHADVSAYKAERLPKPRSEQTKAKEKAAGKEGEVPRGPPVGGGGPTECYALKAKVLLHSVSIRIPKGALTIVLGPTGSGKSSLLDSMVGLTDITAGEMQVEHSVAYVPQQPWVMNATLRDNILFYTPEDGVRFQQALACTQLSTDVTLLPAGLETEIGEKGINLSGGQKARVSLARAVYANKELYLLDDPLSALDAHVGSNVMRECILGALHGRTRVLTTHQEHLVEKADYVIALGSHGAIEYCGDSRGYAAFRSAMEPLPLTASPTSAVQQPAAANTTQEEGATLTAENSIEEVLGESEQATDTATEGKPDEVVDTSGKQMTEEEKAVGFVPFEVYKRYLEACGGKLVCGGILLLFLVSEFITITPQLWLSAWSTDAFHFESTNTYLIIYLICTAANTMCSPLRYWFAMTAMRHACARMHSHVLRSVACATVRFFDVTPLGRILNRFSKDIDQTDNRLPMDLFYVLNSTFSVISSLGIMVFTQYLAVMVLAPCVYVYYRLLLFFSAANREIQRITSIANSPIFSVLGETLCGKWTITAYRKSAVVLREAQTRLDVVFSCDYMRTLGKCWLSVRIELMSSAIVAGVALLGVMSVHISWMRVNIGLVSLSMTMADRISMLLNSLITQLSSVEADMNCVERLYHYVDSIAHEDLVEEVTAEADTLLAEGGDGAANRRQSASVTILESGSPLPSSPAEERGAMEFINADLRYRPGLPLVLKSVSFRIRPKQKVGVVGRTGSGKSTLLLAFLRLVDVSAGSIIVNGVPAERYRLRELRQCFSLIPQDPLLFDGTIQSNVDPFGLSEEAAIWRALRDVGMEDRIREEPGGLQCRVLEGGTNFSVGQRQLLCLARALLKGSSDFLLMDEATANVDTQLDAQIQQTVHHGFRNHTVVTIAHRLNTVATYDLLFLMDQGCLVEAGAPGDLVRQPGSRFAALVHSMGETAEQGFLNALQQ